MRNQDPLIGCGGKCGGLACSLRNVTSAGVGMAAYLRSIRSRSYLRFAHLLVPLPPPCIFGAVFLVPGTQSYCVVRWVSRMCRLEGSNSRIYLHHQYIENPLDPNEANICTTIFVRIYVPRNTKYPTADIEKSTPGRCGDRPPIFLSSADPSAWFQSAATRAHRQSPAVESSMPTHTATEMG